MPPLFKDLLRYRVNKNNFCYNPRIQNINYRIKLLVYIVHCQFYVIIALNSTSEISSFIDIWRSFKPIFKKIHSSSFQNVKNQFLNIKKISTPIQKGWNGHLVSYAFEDFFLKENVFQCKVILEFSILWKASACSLLLK